MTRPIMVEDPEDWEARLVYADWLEERDLFQEAKVQRWLADNKKRPFTTTLQYYFWYEEDTAFDNDTHQQNDETDPQSDLPVKLFVLLAGGELFDWGRCRYRCYNSREEAWQDLNQAFNKQEYALASLLSEQLVHLSQAICFKAYASRLKHVGGGLSV